MSLAQSKNINYSHVSKSKVQRTKNFYLDVDLLKTKLATGFFEKKIICMFSIGSDFLTP